MRRALIAKHLLELLQDGIPRTAPEMVGVLRSKLNLSDVQRKDINSVLYLDLTEHVGKDHMYRWSLLKGPPSITENPALMSDDKSLLLRGIHRLRAGLPPSENLKNITVGAERLFPIISKWLSLEDKSRSMLIIGDYGEGKSHTFGLLKEEAHRVG